MNQGQLEAARSLGTETIYTSRKEAIHEKYPYRYDSHERAHTSLRSAAAAQVSPSDLIAASTLTPLTLEAGKFARRLHKGPYCALHQTCRAGYRALAASALQAKGVCYEAYLNDPCQTKRDELMTAIYQRIE
ncbi:MAG: AraC family transcriptional regulator [Betaproteobacteria bacterium]|nr:AraC family transcriptional regulator [Betaproteobacteria bacterium]NCW82928.1 AraC family transcriptional regulator [Betaproteobacteria bacterium]NCY08647.1 AraC family transcriptional regulator [Betaproteobacteria bacterium]NDC04133.1 AraC family transcriptional regulator [Betaproteobacteria bacterium]NDC86815.1 AraC family transcriptional regulator [Betaproteobacteria bacterium]